MGICQPVQDQNQRILFCLCLFQNDRQVRIGELGNPQNKALVDRPVCHVRQGLLRRPGNGDLFLCRQGLERFDIFPPQIVLNVEFVAGVGLKGFFNSMHAIDDIALFFFCKLFLFHRAIIA